MPVEEDGELRTSSTATGLCVAAGWRQRKERKRPAPIGDAEVLGTAKFDHPGYWCPFLLINSGR
jgi:hypothetical protein